MKGFFLFITKAQHKNIAQNEALTANGQYNIKMQCTTAIITN